jgi:hypothetical protein
MYSSEVFFEHPEIINKELKISIKQKIFIILS